MKFQRNLFVKKFKRNFRNKFHIKSDHRQTIHDHLSGLMPFHKVFYIFVYRFFLLSTTGATKHAEKSFLNPVFLSFLYFSFLMIFSFLRNRKVVNAIWFRVIQHERKVDLFSCGAAFWRLKNIPLLKHRLGNHGGRTIRRGTIHPKK